MTAAYDVLGIGNAIVDVLASTSDAFLAERRLTKGSMQLVDEAASAALYEAMPPAVEVSGGSAANTLVGVASLGGRAAFIGKVADDQLGEVYVHDLRAAGVEYRTPPGTGPSTARCLVLVTPDGERTMNTYLGACADVGAEDVDVELVRDATITYLEGYLWDPPRAKEAFRLAAREAHDAGRAVALTLSDAFCVDRYRDEFRALVADEIDVLFANEAELAALYATPDFDAALDEVVRIGRTAAVTRGAKGSVLVRGGEVVEVPAVPVDKVVDTTGAGDLYAAGVLYGLTHELDLETAGRLGSLCASEIISHLGARPQTSLRDLAVEAGLL